MGTLARVRRVTGRIFIAFIAFMVLGNITILALHLWAQETAVAETVSAPAGIHNFQTVDHKVWRGSRPTLKGYRSLIDRGVTTIVDLRAEEGLRQPRALLRRNDVKLVQIQMRDGQAPSDAQVERFLRVVRRSRGMVYVHCMAGVGRTGTMIGAYLVDIKDESTIDVLRHNLSVGPPSLEQIAFVAGDLDDPNPVVTGVSRVLDGPRRIWSYLD